MNRLFFLLLFIISFVGGTHAAVDLRATRFTTTSGLGNNSVRYMYQDSKGFIWMGTLNGLSRFDGTSFVTFRPRKGNRPSLPDHRVQEIVEDQNCFLWIKMTGEQVGCYDLKKDRFVDFTGCGEYLRHYWNVYFVNQNEAWVTGEREGCRLIRYQEDRTFTSIAFDTRNGLSSNVINDLKVGAEGYVWIATGKGLYCWNGKKLHALDRKLKFREIAVYDKMTYFLTDGGQIFCYGKDQILKKVVSIPNSFVFCDELVRGKEWLIFSEEQTWSFHFDTETLTLAEGALQIKRAQVIKDNLGEHWVYGNNGVLTWIDSRTGKVTPFLLMPEEKRNYVDRERYYVVHDSRGIIWIGTYGNGLFVYDVANGQMKHIVANSDNMQTLIGSDFLQCVMEDHSGNIWVSSEYTGVSRLEVLNEGTLRILPAGEGKFDRSNTVRTLYRDSSGNIILSTRDGKMYEYDSYLNNKKEEMAYGSNIYAVAEDTNGVRWYASRTKGLIVGNRVYMHNPLDSSSLSTNQVFCLLKDHKNRIWVGTFGGGLDLAIPGKDGYRFRHFLTSTYGQRQVRVIFEDDNHWIWVGTSEGVYVFDPDALLKNPKAYYSYTFDNGMLRSNEIRSITSDGKGHILIAESGSGFSVCALPAKKEVYQHLQFEHFGTEDGLVNGMVQTFVSDKNGKVWITTEYGVSCFDISRKTFENYFFSTNMLGNVYAENCGLRLNDGRIALGTNYGLTVIDPSRVKHPESKTKVTFTDLRLNGISVSPDEPDSPLDMSLAYASEVNLRYNQNSFVVEFSTFDYLGAGGSKFSYMLENYDKTWSVPSSLNFAAYKNLSPGTYYLHVKASDASGLWGAEESVLKIVVRPPFWKTPWAYILYIIVLSALLYTVFRIIRNMNTLRNKVKVEEQLTEYKLVFFTNISHEFRTPLTLIQGALEKIHRLKVPKDMAYSLKIMDKSTERMLRLINQLLEFRKMQNNKLALSLEETDVIVFLYEIYLTFKDAAESKNMEFRFIPSCQSYRMFIDKGNVDKVVYNILSNAFKYTPSKGKIEFVVNVDEAAGKLKMSVSDTGVGIPKEKRGELFKRFMQSNFSGDSVGVGLHLTHELVNVHKGTIEYEENPGGGSIFIVTLPTDKSVYEEKDFLVPNNVLLREEEKAEKHLADVVLKDEEVTDEFLPVNPLNKYKVLIVEDDNDVREFLKEEMSVYFEVVTEADGDAGLERARHYDADLIISDVMMPGCSGFELTRKLKNDFNTSHIPVILLTAMTSVENHVKGVECGADAYITKPFSPRLLLARAFKLIEQREKLKEKFSHDPNQVRPALCSSDKDKLFVEKMGRIMETQLGNSQFTVDEFASMMGVGRSIFYRKVRGVTGYSPNEYIRIMRMKKAAELLASPENLTVAEVSYQVGINDPFYFSKCFKLQFGVTPSVYQKGGRADTEKEKHESAGEEE